MTKEYQQLRKMLAHMNPMSAYSIGVDDGLQYGLALVLWELAERKDADGKIELNQAFLSDVASDLERDSREIAAHRLSVNGIKKSLLEKHSIRLDLR